VGDRDSPRVSESWRTFWMLSNRRRPSSTALTIEAKLSSVRIISAASLATSLPVPIAMPTLACLSAGESLTPSPVITQKRPLLWRACTILTLVVGLHLAMTRGRVSIASTSSSVILSKSLATMTAEAGVRSSMMSTSLAIAFAVPKCGREMSACLIYSSSRDVTYQDGHQ
jgi:hypothetical protein